ncbi:MAG: mandelate racemase/muconate lactonizing enzyme family protein, partial [Gammaproteobacteria bacterium]|nr:mandelate racemase/muconate lactonizing enzyme family protein [Gammaproteobacteria bacterium]
IITRVYTRDGIIGESYNGDEYEGQKPVLDFLEKVSPQIIGMSAMEVEKIWDTTLSGTFDILGDRNAAIQAQACIDSAVWDAVGKALGQPLYRLWGGHKARMPILAIAGYYEEGKTLADYEKEMTALRDMGLGGCKFKVGGKSPREDAERVRAAFQVADDDFRICVDANQGYSVREAIEFCRHVEDLDLMWFEEPCPWYDDRRSMAVVRASTGVAIAAGQSERSRAGCRDLMMDAAIDYCNFDASWGGGPTEWRRVAALARCFSVTMAHHEEPQISAHLLASVSNSSYVEVFHPERDPLFYELVVNRNPFDNGMYEVPTGPGLGIELNEEIIRKYKVQ